MFRRSPIIVEMSDGGFPPELVKKRRILVQNSAMVLEMRSEPLFVVGEVHAHRKAIHLRMCVRSRHRHSWESEFDVTGGRGLIGPVKRRFDVTKRQIGEICAV